MIRRPRASRWQIVRRSFAWMSSLARYSWARAKDRLRGDDSVETRGVRLREFFERLGAIATKIGQQLAVRVDFFPPEVCKELGRLMDSAPAFSVEVAFERIESSLGRPVHEVFRRIDPEPIGAASIAVVWRGELLDGRPVAIKVRRPGVAELFAADLALTDLLTTLAESTAMVRPGFFKNLRFELRDMLMNELDFSLEADFQALFRRMVKRDRMRWITSPRVLGELSTDAMMISEFVVGGVPCADVLAAVEGGDRAERERLERQGIDPLAIGKRILALGFWMRMESFFFHADPHPGNIFVLPGNRLILIDFGSCGIASSQQRTSEFEMGRRLALKDIAGSANVAVASLAPLPDIDVERVRRMAWGAFWARTIDIDCGEAEWWERTTASVWFALFNTLGELQLPVNVDTLRLLRASLLTDTLAFRLDRNLDVDAAWKRWIEKASSRSARRARRQRLREQRYQLPMRINELARGREALERGAFWGERFIREVPRDVATSVSRMSFAASLVLRFALMTAVVVLVLMIGLLVYDGFSPDHAPAADLVVDVMTHPVSALVVLLLVMVGLTKLRAKLEEKGRT